MDSKIKTRNETETKVGNPDGRTRKMLQWLGVGILIAALIIAGKYLPLVDWLKSFNEWVAQIGFFGLLLFVVVYILATVLLLPGAILTLGAGFAFGLGWGFVAVSAGSTIGASLAFLIGRYFARNRIEKLTHDKPAFQRIDRAIGTQGAKLVFLLRLSPLVPFNLSNYFYGLTAVRFWPYVLASWIGMMPGTLLYVYFGTLGRAGVEAVSEETGRSPAEWALLILGLLATLTVTIWVSRIARKALRGENQDKNSGR